MQDLGFGQARVPVLNVFTFSIVQLTADSQTQLKNRAGQCKIWTTDYGLPTGYKTRTLAGGVGGYKMRTGYKTRTLGGEGGIKRGLGIKHKLRTRYKSYHAIFMALLGAMFLIRCLLCNLRKFVSLFALERF